MSKHPLPNYSNPPVGEVVLGVFFDPLPIKIPHYGLYWEKIKKDFTHCEHGPFNVLEQADPEGLPVPRVWLIHKNKNYLIQLQKSCFIFNWRKHEGEYPRFKTIEPEFNKYFDSFEKFCGTQDLGDIKPKGYELTYVNHIPINNGWSDISNIKDLFPDLSWRNAKSRYLQNIKAIFWAAEIPMEKSDHGNISIRINPAQKAPENTPILILEIKVQGASNSIKRKKWFDEAHRAIVRSFEDFTSVDVQKNVWGKK